MASGSHWRTGNHRQRRERCGSGRGHARRRGGIRSLKTSEPASLLARLMGTASGGEAKHLSAALQQGDAAAVRILNEVAEDLAFGLSHVVHLFHPEIIVLGGGLSNLGETLRTGVEESLTGFIMEAFRPGPEMVISKLGEDAVTVGALVLAMRER